MQWSFSAELRAWESEEGFLTYVRVPLVIAEEIRELSGSARVTASLGEFEWRTLLVRDRNSGGVHLPVKKVARVAAGIEPGDRVTVTLSPIAP